VTRDEFRRQLEELRFQGHRVFFIGIPLVLLFEIPIDVYVVKRANAEPHSRMTVLMSLYGFAACLAIVTAFYLIFRRTIAKYGPLCPRCAARITWRESPAILDSGQCPYCRKELFRNS
jgi:hypothetical protein